MGRHSKRTQEEEILRKREDRFEKRGEEWNEWMEERPDE